MKTIAMYNLKGGVGKTAAAVNLSWLAADGGARVLLWDLDPQAAATFYFRVKPRLGARTKRLVKGKRNLLELVKSTDWPTLDVLPADFANRNFDVVLDNVKKSRTRLAKLLEDLTDDYDYVFLDCPPSFSVLSENVFHAAQLVLMPLIPTPLSLNSLEQVAAYFADEGLDREQLLPFFSMVDRRKKLHCDTVANPPGAITFCRTAIPYLAEVERMGLERAPLPSFAPGGRAGTAYRKLWAEVAGELEHR